MFQKIPVELPKPDSPKERNQSLLHDIGGGWYMKKLCEKLVPLNKSRRIKKPQEKEDKIRINRKRLIKTGITGNFRYTAINLSG